jgi:tetratricopeptide (TPR) repeat protein
MKAPLFDKILKLSQEIADASASENDELRLKAYTKLQELCQKSLGTKNDHPLQWEALADFTDDGDIALDIYQIALEKAEKFELPQYSASVYLAMAQRYAEFEEKEKALAAANKAIELANSLENNETNQELQAEINELIATLSV